MFVACKEVKKENLTFSISGMVCEKGCVGTIEKKLAETKGILKASVDFTKKTGTVEYDANLINKEEIYKTVSSIGNGSTYVASDLVAGKKCKEGCTKECCKKPCTTDKQCEKSCADKKSDEGCEKSCADKKESSCETDATKPCCDEKSCEDKDGKSCTDKKKCDEDCTKPCCAEVKKAA